MTAQQTPVDAIATNADFTIALATSGLNASEHSPLALLDRDEIDLSTATPTAHQLGPLMPALAVPSGVIAIARIVNGTSNESVIWCHPDVGFVATSPSPTGTRIVGAVDAPTVIDRLTPAFTVAQPAAPLSAHLDAATASALFAACDLHNRMSMESILTRTPPGTIAFDARDVGTVVDAAIERPDLRWACDTLLRTSPWGLGLIDRDEQQRGIEQLVSLDIVAPLDDQSGFDETVWSLTPSGRDLAAQTTPNVTATSMVAVDLTGETPDRRRVALGSGLAWDHVDGRVRLGPLESADVLADAVVVAAGSAP